METHLIFRDHLPSIYKNNLSEVLALNQVCKTFHKRIEKEFLKPTYKFSKKFHLEQDNVVNWVQSDNRRRYIVMKKGFGCENVYVIDMLTDVITFKIRVQIDC